MMEVPAAAVVVSDISAPTTNRYECLLIAGIIPPVVKTLGWKVAGVTIVGNHAKAMWKLLSVNQYKQLTITLNRWTMLVYE
jgi:hypothetical protein